MAENECPNFAGLFTTKVIKSHVKLHVKSDAQKVNCVLEDFICQKIVKGEANAQTNCQRSFQGETNVQICQKNFEGETNTKILSEEC